MHQGCVSFHRCRRGAANWCRQRAASVVDQTANFLRRSPRNVFVRPLLVIWWQIAGNWRFFFLRGCDRPGAGPGLSCWSVVEPPAGIEPATPSLPCIPGPPSCYPASSQVVAIRDWHCYGVVAVIESRPSSRSGAAPPSSWAVFRGLDCPASGCSARRRTTSRR
jgi:hypothetical protein